MKKIEEFWRRLGFNPHYSNYTHFWAGVAVGVTFFPITFLFFYIENPDRLLWSVSISMAAVMLIASLKEWSDHSMRHTIKWKRWDWLDWIYTVLGTVAVILATLLLNWIL